MEEIRTCDPSALPRRWLVLGLTGVGTFMTTLDVSIVNVAMPTLTAVLRTNVLVSQWFVLAYTFTITVLLLTFGRLGDIIGRRRLYAAGICVFTAGSLACALSVTALTLILSRALQGAGSAIMMSCGPAMVTEGFPASERGKALGFIGTAVALGLLSGPVVGGLILEYAGWKWLFLINIPIGIVLVTLLLAYVKGYDTRTDGALDLLGAAAMAIALASVLLVITYGGHLGARSPATIGLVCGAVLFSAAYVWANRRASSPVLDLTLFRVRSFAIGSVAGWANYAALMPVNVFVPFYLQSVLDFSPRLAGLILASGPLTLAFVAPMAGTASDRVGYRALTTVGLIVAGGSILSMTMLGASSSWVDVVWRLVVASIGSALFVSPNSSSIMGSVGCGELGVAGGVVALVRNLGMVCGVAIAGAIITSVSAGFTLKGLQGAFIASACIAFFGAAVSALRS